jgi:hypothetical protein
MAKSGKDRAGTKDSSGNDARRKRGDRPRGKLRPPGPGDPEVLLDVELVDGCFYLVLANDGSATAFDVAVDFARPLPGVGGAVDVAALRVFQGLPVLRSGREIRAFVDVARDLLARRQAKIVTARVTYRSRSGRRLGETFRHDLRIWQNWGEVRLESPGSATDHSAAAGKRSGCRAR